MQKRTLQCRKVVWEIPNKFQLRIHIARHLKSSLPVEAFVETAVNICKMVKGVCYLAFSKRFPPLSFDLDRALMGIEMTSMSTVKKN